MKNKDGLIVGALVGVAVAVYFIAKRKGKGTQWKDDLSEKVNQFSENVKTEFNEKRTEVKLNIADKVFDFAVENRQSIAQVASYVMPYVLKNFVKKKL